MRKFNEIYKEKQSIANGIIETKVLNEFKNTYSILLDKYSVSDFYALNEEEQNTFLCELNSYWNETEGLTEKGKKFCQIRSDVLSESSTALQKKNFLKNKTLAVVSETIRQSGLKWKLYDVLDEMYKETQAKEISEVLSSESITNIFQESFKTTLDNLVLEIKNELNEKKDPSADIRNRGKVVFSANNKNVKDDKDHFPINDVKQARNALARVAQYKSVPTWYKGNLEDIKNRVKNAVKRNYPSIEITNK
jgi:hypothetical protein